MNALAAALSIGLAGFGAALGIGLLCAKSVEGISRQPEMSGAIRTTMIIGVAFVEAIALYALVISFMILFSK